MSLSVSSAFYTGDSGDPKPNDPDTPIGTIFYERDTFRTLYWTGSNWKTYEQLYKDGRWIGISSTGGTSGIFSGIITAAGTLTRIFDSTIGLHQHVATGATINTFAGIKTSSTYAERALNGYIRFVFKLDQVGDCRLFLGWTGYGTIGTASWNSGDLYTNNSAVGLLLVENNSNFQFYHNNGVTPGVIEATPIAPVDTAIHTFELRALNSVPKYQYKMDHAQSWTDIITDIPIETNEMNMQAWIQNTVASDKAFRLVDVMTRIDNKG